MKCLLNSSRKPLLSQTQLVCRYAAADNIATDQGTQTDRVLKVYTVDGKPTVGGPLYKLNPV